MTIERATDHHKVMAVLEGRKIISKPKPEKRGIIILSQQLEGGFVF